MSPMAMNTSKTTASDYIFSGLEVKLHESLKNATFCIPHDIQVYFVRKYTEALFSVVSSVCHDPQTGV